MTRLLGGLLLLPHSLMAVNTATVTVKVTVVTPACTVNGNKAIEVDFKEVTTTRVDGINYRQPVPYTLSCPGAASNTLRLQIQGNAADFDGQALKTSAAGLGIRLKNGNANLAVNGWVNFNYPNKPVLYAVPVRKLNAVLPGGVFTATATMKVDYQ